MPDPISPLQRNQATVTAVERPDGSLVPAQADADGRVIVTADGGSAGDSPELPAPITPGANDPNDPTTFIAARLQLHDQASGTWRNACYIDPGNPLIVPCAMGVWLSGPDVIAVSVTDGGGTPLAAAATPGINDTGVTVRTVSEGDISAIRTLIGSVDTKVVQGVGSEAQAIRVVHANDYVPTVTADQGAPQFPDAPWPVRLSDGLNFAATDSNPVVARQPIFSRTGHGEDRVVIPRHVFSFVAGSTENTEQIGFSGTGAHAAHVATRSQEISVTGVNGQTISFETHTKFPMASNVPMVVRAAVQHSDAGQPDQTRILRLGTSDDYAALRHVGTDVDIVIVSALSGATTAIPRASWLDPMDGTGPSGVDIDWTTFNTFEVIFAGPGASLGMASINTIPVAYVPAYAAGTATLLYASQPVGASITNTAASVAGYMRVRSISCHTLGDAVFTTRVSSVPPTTAARTVATTPLPVLSIRPAANVGGVPNRRFYLPKTLVGSTTGGRVTYRVWRGGSLTAPSWTAAGGSSGLEFDTAATAFNAAGATLIVPFNLSNAVDAGRLDMTAYFEEHWTNAIRNLAFGGGQETITVTAQAAIGSVTVETHLAVDEVGA